VDGLRALAALSVLGYHAWLYTRERVDAGLRDSPADYLAHELRLGLVLFFVLSGFLLYAPWVRAALGDGPEPRVGAFLLRRAGRIVPAYWVAVAGSVALVWGLDGTPGVRLPPAQDLWLFAVFGQNFTTPTLLRLNAPLWTLAVEASFYAVLPLIGWLALRAPATRAGQSIAPALLLGAGIVFNALLAKQDLPEMTLSKSLPAMAPYFAAGMLAAVLIHGRRPSRRAALAMLGAAAVFVIGDAWVHANLVSGSDMALRMRVVRDLPAAAGFAALVALASTRPPRVLAWRPLAFTGLVSYGLYLWHVPVLLVMRANGLLPMSTAGAIAVALPISMLLGWISFRLIEQPGIRWSRRTRIFGANDPAVSSRAPRSARTAHGRTPSTARASG